MNMENKDILEIKDLSIASYLYAISQIKLVGKRRLLTGELLFQFSPKNKSEELIKLYWSLKAPPIQPKILFSAQRDLKDMIFGS